MASPLRIAHVVSGYLPYHSGTAVVCHHNAYGLARRGHDVHIFTAASPLNGYDDPPGVTVHRLPALFRTGNAPLLPRLLTELRGFDVVHLHYPFYFGAELTWLACWLQRIPYVITYHQDVEFAGLLRPAPGLHQQIVGRAILAGAQRLLFTSLDYAATGKLAGYVAAHPDQVASLPNGVDVTAFRPGLPTSDLRQRHGIAADAPVVLFVGGLDRPHYFKGVAVLLQAFAALGGAPARLVIVGDGDLREQYEATARKLGIDDAVVFAGRVAQEDLPRYCNLADVLVLPSTTRGEAFGVVLLEALACGTPVIASRLGGVRSVVDEGRDGWLATPGDADELAAKLRLALADPDAAREMGQAGRRKVVEQYDWPRVVDRLEGYYDDVLAERRGVVRFS